MTSDSPAAHEPGPAEQPTQAAELKVAVGPATAGGSVPPGEAHHYITTFGILVSVIAGIAGAVLTLRIGSGVLTLRVTSGLTILGLAELGVALASAVIIAICGWGQNNGRAEEHAPANPPEPAIPGEDGGDTSS